MYMYLRLRFPVCASKQYPFACVPCMHGCGVSIPLIQVVLMFYPMLCPNCTFYMYTCLLVGRVYWSILIWSQVAAPCSSEHRTCNAFCCLFLSKVMDVLNPLYLKGLDALLEQADSESLKTMGYPYRFLGVVLQCSLFSLLRDVIMQSSTGKCSIPFQ